MSIPDKAVEAGAEELKHWSLPKSPEFLARAVLEAAEPYLTGGDSGLRQALEEMIKNNKVVDRRPRDKYGPIGRLTEARIPTSVLEELLAAHPEVES